MSERRDEDSNSKGPNRERIVNQLESRILTTGAQLQAGGIDWWTALKMIDTLRKKQLIEDERMKVHLSLASLQRDGLVKAQWVLEERPIREFQVTEDGNRARSKVPVTSDSKNVVPGSIPNSERI